MCGIFMKYKHTEVPFQIYILNTVAYLLKSLDTFDHSHNHRKETINLLANVLILWK